MVLSDFSHGPTLGTTAPVTFGSMHVAGSEKGVSDSPAYLVQIFWSYEI